MKSIFKRLAHAACLDRLVRHMLRLQAGLLIGNAIFQAAVIDDMPLKVLCYVMIHYQCAAATWLIGVSFEEKLCKPNAEVNHE